MPGCVSNLIEMNNARTQTPKAALYALLAFIFPARQSSSCVPSSPQRLSMADEKAVSVVSTAPLYTQYASQSLLLRDRQGQSRSDESVHVRQMDRVYDD